MDCCSHFVGILLHVLESVQPCTLCLFDVSGYSNCKCTGYDNSFYEDIICHCDILGVRWAFCLYIYCILFWLYNFDVGFTKTSRWWTTGIGCGKYNYWHYPHIKFFISFYCELRLVPSKTMTFLQQGSLSHWAFLPAHAVKLLA